MMNARIYNKTAKGRAKLRYDTKELSRPQAKILAMIDGKQSLGELSSAMAPAERANFFYVINELENQGLIHLPTDDPATVFDTLAAPVEVTELGPQESVQAWAEATRGAHALKEQGFYANPARVNPGTSVYLTRTLHVLVVDDDDSIVNLLTALLEEKGHVVVSALDALGAMAELKKPIAPDLVLLDVMLGADNGFDILAAIRQDARLSKLPVIMVTAQIGDAQVMNGLKYGADGYIFKPFKWATLYACIQAVTGYL